MLLATPTLANKHIVLASGSPRRVELLQALRLNLSIKPSTFPEDLDKSKFTPSEYVIENAHQKALDVFRKLVPPADLVIGADTVVVLNEKILEKPKDKQHAFEMLSDLSGKRHVVYTGVSLLKLNAESKEPDARKFFVSTEVEFLPLPPAVIQAYVDSGEPMDKAGGYGIQGIGCSLVKEVSGCYFNVIGFPVSRFCLEMLDFLKLS